MAYSEGTYRSLLGTNPGHAARYAGQCRAACAKLGRPAPPWAASTLPASEARARQMPAPATPAERDFTGRASALFDEHAALRAPGRVLALSADGAVRFFEYRNGVQLFAEFANVAAALAAVSSGSIAWGGRRDARRAARLAARLGSLRRGPVDRDPAR